MNSRGEELLKGNIRYLCRKVHSLGPGERTVIWFSGCEKNCEECLSPELQASYPSDSRNLKEVVQTIKNDRRYTFSGGEPFLQLKALSYIIDSIADETQSDILIYTGFLLEELQQMTDPLVDKILKRVNVIVDGPYMNFQNSGRGMAGSSNQKINYLNVSSELMSEYEEYRHKQNGLEVCYDYYTGQMMIVGIPGTPSNRIQEK